MKVRASVKRICRDCKIVRRKGVLFVSNNNESLVFNCRDGSKRGVDLAATSYLHKIGWISKEPYKYIESTLIFKKQNIRAVEIEVV